MNQPITIKCPHCDQSFSIDQALTHQMQQEIKQELELDIQRREKELGAERLRLKKQAEEIAESKVVIEQRVAEKMIEEGAKIEKQVRERALQASSLELQSLKSENQQIAKKLSEAQKAELLLRAEKQKLELDKQSFETEKQRQLDSERQKIRSEATKQSLDEYQLKVAEKEKKITDMQRTIEELRRQAQQGSQQTQGEVMELELETMLRSAFPIDDISPIGKGVSGADVIQKVIDRFGRYCGSIIWESKRTKAWSDGWISKLKDDQRVTKAEVAVLLSQVLPAEIKNFGEKEGIWVTNHDCFLMLASILRSGIVEIEHLKTSMINKGEKMDILFRYITGTEFHQRVEVMMESFVVMKRDLEKEKLAYTKIWANREKQIQRVLENTSGMIGDVQGLTGVALPMVAQLELSEGELNK